MLHIDLPTRADILKLADVRAEPCVTIYVSTTPRTADVHGDRIALKNLATEAQRQCEAAGIAKRAIWPIAEAVAEIEADDAFWAHQANSLALFLTPERTVSYRLPNRIPNQVHVSDRFHIKPVLRAVTFPQDAWVLAIGKGGVRLIEISPDLPPHNVKVPGLPKDMADALGRRSHGERTGAGTSGEGASEGALLRRYARTVDEALRPVLSGHERPLILAATEPVAPVFHAVCSYPHLLPGAIPGSADHTPDHVLADGARKMLDAHYAAGLAELAGRFANHGADGRAVSDIAQAARAATAGAIDTLIVDMDVTVPGTVADDGSVTFADTDDAVTYGVVDEIVARALRSGARIVAARQGEVPGGGALAAILRYPV